MHKTTTFQISPSEQCVAYVRRWLRRRMGLIFADVNIAADVWDKINAYIRIRDGKKIAVINIHNGAETRPEINDVLIYCSEFYGTGHVAVINRVDTAGKCIEVCEQNYKNQKLPYDHCRQIPLIRQDDKFWLLEPYLIGWKTLR